MLNQSEKLDINSEINTQNNLIELSTNKDDLNKKININNLEPKTNFNEDKFQKNDDEYNKKDKLYFENLMPKTNEISTRMRFIEKLKKDFLTKNNLYLLISNIIGIIFYHFCLMPCDRDPTTCTIKNGLTFYIKIGIFTLISSIFFSLYAVITIYYNEYFFHSLYLIPTYVYYIVKYKGADTYDHGFYNGIGWILFNIILIPLFLFCFRVYNLIKNRRYKNIIAIIVILLICIIYYNNLSGFSCDYWDLGLNNTRIDNDKNKFACEILIPQKNKCYLKKMDKFFDFSKIFRPSCTSEKIIDGEKQVLLKALDKKFFGISKLNHFGYPITTFPDKFIMTDLKELDEYQELINHNIIKMDLYNKENYPDFPHPEVELFFDESNHGKIKINVKKNETLSKERKEIAKDKHSLFNNVLIIYMDTVSRNLFHRKMKKLSELIAQYMPYNLNERKKPYTSFEFLKYNTLRDLTFPNIKAMFYGISFEEQFGVNVLKYYKKQGYVTGHTGTSCGREIYSVNSAIEAKYLDYDVWDHENIALFCDPNFFNSHYTLYKGVASYLKRCLYGKYAFEYMIEYSKQFWETYPDNKKFYRIHFNEGHEGSMELISYLADPLFEFIKYFFDNNLLDDTFIIFISDHGNHVVGPWSFIRSQDYLLESTLAALFCIIPNNKKIYDSGLYDILHENQQVFVTPFDVHDSMVHIAFGYDKADNNSYSKKGSSLLSYIDPMERYCENPAFNLNIKGSFCKCKKYKK